MTVGVAWIREAARGDELWIATDSRLSGNGQLWDDCPKILVPARRDMAIAFSGSTAEAYPLMLQIATAVAAYAPAADGALEFTALIEHLERVVNDMLARIETDPGVRGVADPRAFTTRGDVLLLGGYSRHVRGFVLRALQHHADSNRWGFTKARTRVRIGERKIFRVFGDRIAAPRYDFLLRALLQSRGKLKNARPFDLEPLEVLWRMLTMSPTHERPLPLDRRPLTVGGAPQVVQTLAGGQTTRFAVRWRRGVEASDYLLGRRVMPYEHLNVPLIEQDFGTGALRVHGRGQWSLLPVPPA